MQEGEGRANGGQGGGGDADPVYSILTDQWSAHGEWDWHRGHGVGDEEREAEAGRHMAEACNSSEDSHPSFLGVVGA